MSTFATGNITFQGNALNDLVTLTINGVEYVIGSFTADPSADVEMAVNLVDSLDLEVDPAIVNAITWSRSGSEVIITAKTAGAAGNSITLATINPSTVLLSGATLTGGSDAVASTLLPYDNSEEALFFLLTRSK